MRALRIIILLLILLDFPSFSLGYISSTLGTLTSYLIIGLLGLHFILDKKKKKPLIPFLLLALTYYFISSFVAISEAKVFILDMTKTLTVILCGADLLRKTTNKEIYYILLLGGASIAINAIFLSNYNANFTESYGRYSGFYLNPNYAGGICLLGFSLSHYFKEKKLHYLGLLLFTLGGFFTLSRYFMLMWVLINFISVFLNRKNIVGPAVGGIVLIIVFSFASLLQLKADRFGAIEGFFSGEKTTEIRGEGRSSTWSNYTDIILDSPFFGNGYKTLHGNSLGQRAGVHNTYLMLIGEAGIIPFLICLSLYLYMVKKSFQKIRKEPAFFYFSIILFTFLLVGHNYFSKYYLLFLSMYLFITLTERSGHHKEDVPNENFQKLKQ